MSWSTGLVKTPPQKPLAQADGACAGVGAGAVIGQHWPSNHARRPAEHSSSEAVVRIQLCASWHEKVPSSVSMNWSTGLVKTPPQKPLAQPEGAGADAGAVIGQHWPSQNAKLSTEQCSSVV